MMISELHKQYSQAFVHSTQQNVLKIQMCYYYLCVSVCVCYNLATLVYKHNFYSCFFSDTMHNQYYIL